MRRSGLRRSSTAASNGIIGFMIHLRSIEYRPFPEQSSGNYPFNLPLVQSLKTIQFDAPVTFLSGERQQQSTR
jgi:predicted ATPase